MTQIYKELAALALEFAALRQSSKKRWFPPVLWQRAFSMAQRLPAAEICRAIKVHPAYFQKKMILFTSDASDACEPPTFVEVFPGESFSRLTIRVENQWGHKLSIEGASLSSLVPLLAEFLKGGMPCSK
jgi:hypothetical protein